jgi:hypothetical protein
MIRPIALSLFVALCGCMTAEQRQARIDAAEDAQCRQYGAQPGTQTYYQCRMALNERQKTVQRLGGVEGALDRIANPPSSGLNCTSMQTGTVISTNCR